MTLVRLVALVAAAVIAVPAGGSPASANGVRPTASTAGSVRLDGGVAGTSSVDVTVSVPAPTDSSNLLRLSDDGGSDWVQRPWTTSFTWSLVDAAAGGTNVDGAKTVTVQGGDGSGAWTDLGADSILLDRTGPDVGVATLQYGQRVQDVLHLDATDDGIGLDRTEVSLDGVHWRALIPNPFRYQKDGFLDVRDGLIGGSWQPGSRTILTRAVDRLGNVTEAAPLTDDVEDMRSATDPPADFAFPRPAVTGHLFTIAPTFDAGFRVPDKSYCVWTLKWGDQDARINGAYDVTLGSVVTTVLPNAAGTCDPWTFTLPYSDPREYTWYLGVGPSDTEAAGGIGDLDHVYSTGGSFRAALGGTSREITESSLPLIYITADDDYAGAHTTITYRLHSVGGASTAGGVWGCQPSDGSPLSAFSGQLGGDVFECRVTTSEPYVAMWDKSKMYGDWLASYDPIGDVSRPAVPYLHVAPAPGGSVKDTTVPLRLDWTGVDRGSGVRRYAVEVRRDGKAWRSLRLSTARSTHRSVTATIGTSYRFRVRAVDRAGNVGAWRYSATLRPAVYDDRSPALHWSSGWRQVTATGALNGRLHRTARAAQASVHFTGRGAGLLASRSPDAGFVQVVVDGRRVATLDLRGRAGSPRIVWAAALPSGRHVITIRGLGTRGRPVTTVDGFAVTR